MAEVGQDFQCFAGDDTDIFIRVLGYDGLPLDLTDCLLSWGLGDVNTSPALLTKTSADPAEIEILDTAGGEIAVHLDPPDTRYLAGHFRHELKIRDPFAGLETILTGWIIVYEASVHPAQRSVPRSVTPLMRVVA